MAALHLHPPPRTPSPKIRIHRSQSFDSPSSRISATPIDESPYSKSTSALQHAVPLVLNPLPSRDVLSISTQNVIVKTSRPGRRVGAIIHATTRQQEEQFESPYSSESEMDLDPSSPSSSGSEPASPSQPFHTQRHQFRPSHHHHSITNAPVILPSPSNTISITLPVQQPRTYYQPEPLPYQDPTSLSTMYSPYLVRLVLDLYDVRGLAWTDIAEPITRVWGIATSSAEVLGILCGNGRVGGVMWWD
ncbi:uncharacterized protein EI97DRAFT_241980 [Westerdykella ornata]|uniref:Uncharacterized protein n=1 Tax=Westerdykella ornata TaxID=318751 RepID=A0A6A6J6N8_WESOR|nr:uncharacterized protein EI97DRAFT_241980 [Westerdykella ornata]KAF2271877.1 hypothetical protein EI97DRAFT_241980 [Westerdykella ornata]